MTVKNWKLLSSRKDKSFKIFDLRIDRAVSPRTGNAHDFYILEFADWVNVIPITEDNNAVLIKQYRHGTREVTLEIPGGILEPGDTPEEGARRELMEETGYRDSEMICLGMAHSNPAFLNNRCYIYLARNVYPEGCQMQDDKEDIETVLMPVDRIPGLIRDGVITHSLIIASFYKYYMEYLPEQKSGVQQPSSSLSIR